MGKGGTDAAELCENEGLNGKNTDLGSEPVPAGGRGEDLGRGGQLHAGLPFHRAALLLPLALNILSGPIFSFFFFPPGR